jgi:predicted transcriptional regulator
MLASMKLDAYLSWKKLSQAEFAQSLGITQARVSQLCAGQRPSLALAQMIERATESAVGLGEWPEKKAA